MINNAAIGMDPGITPNFNFYIILPQKRLVNRIDTRLYHAYQKKTYFLRRGCGASETVTLGCKLKFLHGFCLVHDPSI